MLQPPISLSEFLKVGPRNGCMRDWSRLGQKRLSCVASDSIILYCYDTILWQGHLDRVM